MEAEMTVQNKTLPKQPDPEQSEGQSGCLPVLARLFWMVGGIATLLFCGIYIVMRKATFAVYLIYILVTISLVGVRFIDIKYFMGETVNGERASLSHWRRYTLQLLIFAGLLFIAAKILAQWNLL
jgi:hypothetical protein